MTYPLTFYTDFGIPEGFAGCARGPFIFIRPEYKGDAGLLAHETEHVKQWFLSLGLHSLLYLLSDRYKIWSEVQAYREQLRHSPGKEATYAKFIATRYGLEISEDEALRRLMS